MAPLTTKDVPVPYGRNFLMVPGPTNVPQRVQNAMHRNSEDHRSLDFPKLGLAALEAIKKVFQCRQGHAFIFPGTGTLGWEAALTNCLDPQDQVISVRFGQFSHLWIDMMKRLGLRPIELDVEWGEGLPMDRMEGLIQNDRAHDIKAVCVVHNETTTGVCTDIPAVRRLLDKYQHPALLMVDGVSSIGAVPFKFDEWRVDLAVTGSQKALMLPAGLGFVCASPRALERSKTAKLPHVYMSFQDHLRSNVDGFFPYTPSVPLLYGLVEAVKMLEEEGFEQVWARHHKLAEGVRRAVRAWNLEICCRDPRLQSDTVTTVMLPQGVDGVQVVKVAFQKYNLSLGAGLMRLRGKAFRISSLGDLNELTILGALAGVEMTLRECGYNGFKLGAGVAAAAEYYQQHAVQARGFTEAMAKI
ncbi:serine-glyoxylate aminotransferase [Cyanidioschyzon merolae strain 10D]|uniref:alanine--glyoxylate transaminase n=1 Tax=Cyanidioschyzon merolae (strain NIES-3377 / 10D) TaxID=280699 RepID=M1VHT4_CYAM1|nr:serine-glyoxylate aminotransferase [Cyanidioschyzon merolae strain 10D]BAM82987.1 serine-glyoxylate aminotransferase [Cyanidioschyzon merolae strain 10D]|eukprot:XP_005539023.1 serine-glyoxylate aminotransferase [Cyanidioschyzon merolae strain 10D]